MEAPLWQPSRERVERANLTAFLRRIEEERGVVLPDYRALHGFSVAERETFWRSLWSFADVVGDPGEVVLADGERMPGARWFPEARLNFAENLLRAGGEGVALVFRGEDGERLAVSRRELRSLVSSAQQALRAQGLAPGDRVAGILPNSIEAVVAMLAATSLGVVWSSCSPDFGVRGAVDRFGQIEPRILFAADRYTYAGKTFDTAERAAEIAGEIPSVERLVIAPFGGERPAALPTGPRPAVDWHDWLAAHPPRALDFERLPFDHPVYILFSSGTTGTPKCIVHGAGGTLLQHLKEHRLQVDLSRDDRIFYFTTCGWMMWNWLVSALASEATLLLYDGSPFHPGASALFDLAAEERANVFGISAKFLDAVAKTDLVPAESHDLSSLRTVLSTGSPLAPEGFDYVYEKVKSDVCLSSITGGTDIISCFIGGDPTGPVWRGELQAPGLGMDVAVFDESGHAVTGEKGELVCRRAFPSMPLGFFGDESGARYRAAYFEKFPGVWCHGDFAELTEHGGAVIHGRSDTVLNPGGVRIGTAEIYRPVEGIDRVLESLAIGQPWEGDVRVVLFVRLRAGSVLDDALEDEIRSAIRRGATPRHVPARIVQVSDIPRTRSGKIVELAVARVVAGLPVENVEALANPEALALFDNLPELSR